MTRFFFLIALLSVVALNFGCKKPPTQPPDEKPTTCTYPPGNRNFTWKMDTVAWFPSTLGGVWAFSDSDAYVMGYIVDNKPPYTLRAGRHWNGKIWEDNINGTYGYDNITEKWGDIAIDPRNDVTGDDHFMVAVGWWGHSTTTYAGIAEFDNSIKKWKSYQLQAVGELRSVWTDGKGYFIAAGDNGMVYTKNGYTAEWAYQKAPTEFNFLYAIGIDKNECYLYAHKYLVTGDEYSQIWKLINSNWIKLSDTQESSGEKLDLVKEDYPYNLSVYRCSITDSIKIYVTGWESYLFEGIGQTLLFRKTNLTNKGLPLHNNGRSAYGISLLSPNDIWIQGSRYNNYHWNGKDFQRMIIPGLPNDDNSFGMQLKVRKTNSGKVFYTSEVSSQVYVVIQGVP